MSIRLIPDLLTHGDEALGLPRCRSNWIEPTGKPPRYEGPVEQSHADALAVREWLAHVEAGRIG